MGPGGLVYFTLTLLSTVRADDRNHGKLKANEYDLTQFQFGCPVGTGFGGPGYQVCLLNTYLHVTCARL